MRLPDLSPASIVEPVANEPAANLLGMWTWPLSQILQNCLRENRFATAGFPMNPKYATSSGPVLKSPVAPKPFVRVRPSVRYGVAAGMNCVEVQTL